MGSTSDQASTMTLALQDFEGAPCVDHKIQNALKHASRGEFISLVEKKCRGVVAHFRRSNKVSSHPNLRFNSFCFCGIELSHIACSTGNESSTGN